MALSGLTDTKILKPFALKPTCARIDQSILKGEDFTLKVEDVISNIMLDYAKPRQRMEITCYGKLNGKDIEQIWSYKVTHDGERDTLHCKMIRGTPDAADDLSFRTLLGK